MRLFGKSFRSVNRRRLMSVVLFACLLATLGSPGTGIAARTRPKVVPLPDGFQPEGIETRGPRTFFAGSIPTGAIYKGNLKTGRGDVFVPGEEGRSATGLALRDGMLFVSGGQTGQAYVYDASNGDEFETFQLTTEETFINDVEATADAAYFTDSVSPFIYKVPIEGKGEFGTPETLPITGELVYVEGFNANGIEATTTGDTLIVVQSNTGKLFTVDPESGSSSEIDLGDELVENGDGILLDGDRRLWVVQNQTNELTRVRLAADLSTGDVVRSLTRKSFDVPTTVARSRDYLVLVNARFGIESPETAEYWVTQLLRPL